MIIQMSNREFQEMRKFLIALKDPKVTKAFNEVFDHDIKGGVKGFVNPLNRDIVIEVPEHLTYEVEKVFVKYGPDIGKMIKGGGSIANAPKWLSCIKNIIADITNAITHR